MKIALTGATGLVGRPLARVLAAAGHAIDPLAGWRLGEPAPLAGCDALVHAAFAHVPGRYRGGEGGDPAGFRAANLDGTLRLFDEAAAQGIGRIVFLSSRAVYDGHPPGSALPDGAPARPVGLYAEVKCAAEEALGGRGASIRATGVYAPLPGHKWTGLFRDYLAGRPVPARVATEVHGDDLGDAVLRLLTTGARGVFNCSDIVLDHHDLLSALGALSGCPHPPPPPADAGGLSVMSCERLAALGWRPGGMARLLADLPDLAALAAADAG